jgi:DNA-directed RNA polymerase subunit F
MEKRCITLSEVKNILKKAQREREELIYEQKTALKHAEAFARLSVSKAKKLVEELLKEGLEEKHAYKITDLLPTHEDDIKMIFAKERVSPSGESIKKILDIVSKYIE